MDNKHLCFGQQTSQFFVLKWVEPGSFERRDGYRHNAKNDNGRENSGWGPSYSHSGIGNSGWGHYFYRLISSTQ
jgi:hypothetical protein